MKNKDWDRAAVITHVREDIWRYLTQAARTDDEVLLEAAALLQMPSREVRTLAQLQFMLSDEVGAVLHQMPQLVRRLTTTTAVELEQSAERVRGPVRWPDTFAARAASGAANVFVTAPPRRAFETPENEVLVFLLEAIAGLGRRTGWHRSQSAGVGREVQRRVHLATRWRRVRPLADVMVRQPSDRTVARARAGRRSRTYSAVLSAYRLYQRYIADLDRQAIRDAVEQNALVTSRDPVLLELLCAFTIVRELRGHGWEGVDLGLLRTPRIFRGRKNGRIIDVYYQHAPPDLSLHSEYRRVQRAHGFASVGGLIPDTVLRIREDGDSRWVLVEVKGVQRPVADSARAALLDLLAYRRAFSATLGSQMKPYGVGVAWGRDLVPVATTDVVLCSPDRLGEALSLTTE